MVTDIEMAKKTFAQELLDNGGKLKYDMTREDHRAVFFERYGGEQEFKRDMPMLYAALFRPKEDRVRSAPRAEGGALLGGEDAVRIDNMTIDEKNVTSMAFANFCTRKQIAAVAGELVDHTNNKSIGVFSSEDESVHQLQSGLALRADKLVQSNDRELYTEAEFLWADCDAENTLCATGMRVCSDMAKVAGKTSIIKKVTLYDPIPAEGKDTTLLLYDRDCATGEASRYQPFRNVYFSNGDIRYIMINMPFKVKIELNDGWDFIFKNTDIVKGMCMDESSMHLDIEQLGSPSFDMRDQASKITVTYDDKTPREITYTFPTNWNHGMETHFTKVCLRTEIYAKIAINCKKGALVYDKGQVAIIVNSNPEVEVSTTDPGNCIAKKIDIKVGCLAKGTMLTMADGSTRAIEDIRVGDMVMKADGGRATVTDIYTGFESELVCVRTFNDREIMLTPNHPMQVAFGGEKRFMHPTDIDGTYRAVTQSGTEELRHLYMRPYDDTVYNLELDQPGAIFANGFVVGDMQMQNGMEVVEEPMVKAEHFDTLRTEFSRAVHNLTSKSIIKTQP